MQSQFSRLLGPAVRIENPFLWRTKTDVAAAVKAAGLVRHTVSCAHMWETSRAQPNCGKCSQCIDRKLGAVSAGLSQAEDPDARYRVPVLTGAFEGVEHRTIVERVVGTAYHVRQMHDPARLYAEYGDFPAVGAMTAAAALAGRKVGVRPKRYDDRPVIPNLWGAVIGRPGIMKTPALQEPLRPLKRLDKGESAEAVAQALAEAAGPVPPEPVRRRYLVNDSTVEKLGDILNEDPAGALVYRDELVGLLKSLDREGQEGGPVVLPGGVERERAVHVRPDRPRDGRRRGRVRVRDRRGAARPARRPPAARGPERGRGRRADPAVPARRLARRVAGMGGRRPVAGLGRPAGGGGGDAAPRRARPVGGRGRAGPARRRQRPVPAVRRRRPAAVRRVGGPSWRRRSGRGTSTRPSRATCRSTAASSRRSRWSSTWRTSGAGRSAGGRWSGRSGGRGTWRATPGGSSRRPSRPPSGQRGRWPARS